MRSNDAPRPRAGRRVPGHRRPDPTRDPRSPARRPRARERARQRGRAEPSGHLEAPPGAPGGAARVGAARRPRARLRPVPGSSSAGRRLDRGLPRILASQPHEPQTTRGEEPMTISKSGARAVAAVGEGTIVGIVEIAAPVERVFRALTDGDEITKWWGSPELYRTTGWVADLRPGGHWRASGVGADGASFHVEGDYREVDPPHRLVHTWKAPWDGDNETTVSYKLEAIEGGTRVTLRHEGFGDPRLTW